MIAYKVFIENEDGVLTPYYFSRCGFLYSRTELNERRDGYGPFSCYDTLRSVLWDSPWLATSPNYKNTLCFSVEITKSASEHIWSPGNKLPLSNEELTKYTVLADDFKLVEQINLKTILTAEERRGCELEKFADIKKKYPRLPIGKS